MINVIFIGNIITRKRGTSETNIYSKLYFNKFTIFFKYNNFWRYCEFIYVRKSRNLSHAKLCKNIFQKCTSSFANLNNNNLHLNLIEGLNFWVKWRKSAWIDLDIHSATTFRYKRSMILQFQLSHQNTNSYGIEINAKSWDSKVLSKIWFKTHIYWNNKICSFLTVKRVKHKKLHFN